MTPPPTAAAAIPATRPAPARRGAPIRPAGPARTRPTQPRRAAAPVRRPGRAAGAAAAAFSPARLLERLIRSRSCIGLVAFALIGIVAMQLWLLKLNGGIGRAIEHEELLQRENAVLSAENSSMAAGDLVEQQAIASGMRIVSPGSLIFLRTRGQSDERLAAGRLAQPVQTPTMEGVRTAENASIATASPSSSPSAESPSTAASTEGSAQTTHTATPSTAAAEASAPTTSTAPAPTTSTAPGAASSTAQGGASAPTTPTSPQAGG
jgi:hypothetical protein